MNWYFMDGAKNNYRTRNIHLYMLTLKIYHQHYLP